MISESPIGEWLDNPIFVKHVRSRLRPLAVSLGVVIVLILCGVATTVGFEFGGFRSGSTFAMIYVLGVIMLGLMGASQIGSTVGWARASGVLEFHRISPLSAAELTLGFLLGAPVREYLLFLVTLPFLGLCMYYGVPTPRAVVQLVILLICSAWLIHAFAMLISLVSRKPNASRSSGALTVLLSVLGIPLFMGVGRSLPLLNANGRLDFFGISLPWLGFVLINESVLLAFMLIACLRKMRSERAHALSKPQAMLALVAVALLVMGGFWNQIDINHATLILVYAAAIAAAVLISVTTPDRTEYTTGLLRARKLGLTRLKWWNDLAWNRGFLVFACAAALIAPTIAWRFMIQPPNALDVRFPAMPLAIANGMLVVAYFGLAVQYFLLRFRKNGSVFAGAFLFLAWGLPLIVGSIIASSSPLGDQHAGRLFLAMSPIFGIALSAAPVPDPNITQLQFSAICPTLLFVFLFSGLAVSARRRIDREVRSSFEGKPGAGIVLERIVPPLAAGRSASDGQTGDF